MLLHSAHRFHTAPARTGWLSGVHHPGISARDLIGQVAKRSDQEDGISPRGVTRRWISTGEGLELPAIPQWHREARCADPAFDAVDFFKEYAKARKACDSCPVRLACLVDALEQETVTRLCYGVRGGMLATERLTLIRKSENRGTVYFGTRDGLIKIGCTRGSADQRMKFIRCDLLATEPGLFTRERELHKRFAHLLARGHEWFKPGADLIDYIAALPDARVQAVRLEPAA